MSTTTEEHHMDMSLDEIAAKRSTSNTTNNNNNSAHGKAESNIEQNRQGRKALAAPYSSSSPARTLSPAPESARTKSVYVGNLDYSVRWPDLKEHFQTIGPVEHADVMMQSNGRSKGCGIVRFEQVEDAVRAIEELNETELNGRNIFIREDREYEDGGGSGTRVFVGNLAYNCSWQDLKDHMASVGEIKYCDVLMDNNQRSRGCGLVEYATADAAAEAIRTMTETELRGRVIFVREDREADKGSIRGIASRMAGGRGRGFGRGRGGGRGSGRTGGGRGGSNASGTTVYIANLPFETTWQDLKDFCRHIGDVEHVEMQGGSASVRFSSNDDASTAIKNLNDTTYDGRTIKVSMHRFI